MTEPFDGAPPSEREVEPTFRDTLYTVDKKGRRRWVYPHIVIGRFIKRRSVVAALLMAFYLSMPWISINNMQGILLDFPHRRFIFFGEVFWATDTIFLFLVIAMLGFTLFLVTAVLGRAWCGWACPETVFLEFLFRPIERLIEGSDAERRRLDAAPWGPKKILKKGLKHLLCAAAAWVLASTALAYFIGREPLLQMMTHSPFENLTPFLMTVALMGVMAFQFGWFREQFCTVLCPYARFQSVLMDPDSLLVGYDRLRGEPRGKLRRNDPERGDCVDCHMCVRVCPTGIDIRNGTQLECVACAACIDACDSIMAKIGKPKGLIRYDTEAHLQGRKTGWVRPRIFVYVAVLSVLLSVFVFKVLTRDPIDLEIIRASHAEPYQLGDDQRVTNQFSLRLANKGLKPFRVKLVPVKPADLELLSPAEGMEFRPNDAQQVPVFVRAPLGGFSQGELKVIVDIVSTTGTTVRRELTLLGPAERDKSSDNK